MNLDKLDAAIAYIEAHPERHDQRSWFAAPGGRPACGTTACLAGTVVVLDGWEPDWLPGYYQADYVTKEGARRGIPELAAELLDACPSEADALFLGAADLGDIKAVRDAIAAGADPWSALPEQDYEDIDGEGEG